MDQGLTQVQLASKLRVNEMTIVNWERRGIIPVERLRKRLRNTVPEAGKWLDG